MLASRLIAASPRVLPMTAAVLVGMLPAIARGQSAPLRITVPTIVVEAQKEPEDKQKLPVSVTAVSKETIDNARITTISEAAIYAPNTFYSEFQARKLSFPRFRGISSGPGNPAISTYVDGVPALHTNASSIELLDVEQVELVRGAQSGLFGRNALGGIVNVASTKPSLSDWKGGAILPFGNFSAWDLRANVNGPLSDKAGISLAAGRSSRDGFTVNDLTGQPIDNRSNVFGKAQLYWLPAERWETRVIVSAESADDGDYALNDLGALRTNPFHASRDYVGYTTRDVFSLAALTKRAGERITLSTTTGIVGWNTADSTDLDYTPLPLITRDNDEDALQFTQEVRLASSPNAALRLSDAASLRWQAGVFFFTQGYDQNAVNHASPYVFSPLVPFAVSQTSPQAALDDLGLGVYGQATLGLRERLDLTFGARVDYENKQASLDTFYTPAVAPPTVVNDERSFSNVSPQVSATYRLPSAHMIYGSFGSGFKAGGFNPASPAGQESYGEEHTWQFEGGIKTSWADGRLTANAAFFHIDWSDMQLNVPNPQVPAQFYIANVSSAASTGGELELNARAHEGVDLFASVGLTRARFGDNSFSSGADVSGNRLPSTPDFTTTLGAQLSHPLSSALSLYGRAEATFYGGFDYDDMNTAGQDAYSLANLRAGLKGRLLFGEVWTRNAFDTRYIPVAFTYQGFAPSGFVGEMGRPRTFGLSVGVTF